MKVGREVGSLVGNRVGATVGSLVGRPVRCAVGSDEGRRVGFGVGLSVLKSSVGTSVGYADGTNVGWSDGCFGYDVGTQGVSCLVAGLTVGC